MTLDVELKTEIRRLRKVAQRVVDLDLSAFDLNGGTAPHDEFLDLKRAAQFALDGVKDALEKHYKPMSEVRALANAANADHALKRHQAVMREIDKLTRKYGKLSYQRLALALDQGGEVKPLRGEEWSPSSVRHIMLTLGLGKRRG